MVSGLQIQAHILILRNVLLSVQPVHCNEPTKTNDYSETCDASETSEASENIELVKLVNPLKQVIF